MAGPDAATILDLEDRRFQAMTANDLVTLDRLIADDLRFVHSNGTVEDKAEFLRPQRPKVWVGLPRDVWGLPPSQAFLEMHRLQLPEGQA